MALRGQPETLWGVGADGVPGRYQQDAHGCAQQSGRFIVNLGGTAEVYAFVPGFQGQKHFLFLGFDFIQKERA